MPGAGCISIRFTLWPNCETDPPQNSQIKCGSDPTREFSQFHVARHLLQDRLAPHCDRWIAHSGTLISPRGPAGSVMPSHRPYTRSGDAIRAAGGAAGAGCGPAAMRQSRTVRRMLADRDCYSRLGLSGGFGALLAVSAQSCLAMPCSALRAARCTSTARSAARRSAMYCAGK